MKTIYLLFDGSSEDGRGTPSFIEATEDRIKALSHYQKVTDNPYSTGYVQVLTKTSLERMQY